MKRPDEWALGCVRMVLLAARLEGVRVVLREDGATVARGGNPSPGLLRLLAEHRDALAWSLHQTRATAQSVRRAEGVTCAAGLLPAEVGVPDSALRLQTA